MKNGRVIQGRYCRFEGTSHLPFYTGAANDKAHDGDLVQNEFEASSAIL